MAKPFFGVARVAAAMIALIAIGGSSVSASKLVRQRPLDARTHPAVR